MKIRSDFVTNSSSSSFVVAFKDKDCISKDLRSESLLNEERIYNLIEKINKGEMSKEAILESFEDQIKWNAKYAVEQEIEDRMGYRAAWDWMKDNQKELDNRTKEIIKQWKDDLINKLEGMKFFSIINISDHHDGELEHNIMPYLGCCMYRISHH